MAFICYLLAFVSFLLSAVGFEPFDKADLTVIGLMFVALGLMLSTWPGHWFNRNPN